LSLLRVAGVLILSQPYSCLGCVDGRLVDAHRLCAAARFVNVAREYRMRHGGTNLICVFTRGDSVSLTVLHIERFKRILRSFAAHGRI
jgi:hypothetical protein